MKNLFTVVYLTFAVILFSSGNSYAFDESAKKLFDDGQYDECIKKIESLPELKKQMSNVMLLAYSNYQLYLFTKQDRYEKVYDTYNDLVFAKAGIDDLTSILFFVNSSDKPEVVKSSRKLLKVIFANLHKIEEVVKLIPFATSSDKEVREYAFDSMERIMEPIRDIVKHGGTMRPVDLRYFKNKDIIKTAVDNVNISTARNVLLIIEEPALEFVSNSTNEDLIKISEKISRAISDRKKEFPDSSWYSATGKQIKMP